MSNTTKSWLLALGWACGAVTSFVFFIFVLNWSCGDEEEASLECMAETDCAAKTCYDGACKSGSCVYTASASGTKCSTGYCLEGACRSDLCFITGETTPVAKDGVSSTDPCKICYPDKSLTNWSAVVCSSTAANSCLQVPTCVASITCKGTSCCLSKPVWDGTGTAPACTLPSGKAGICTNDGKCAGCNTATDCDTKDPCLLWTCDANKTCVSTYTSASCEFKTGVSNSGICVNGVCMQKCTSSTECPTTQYCGSGGYCTNKLANGAPCSSSTECSSGYCVSTVSGDTEAKRCAVSACGSCQGADILGSCKSQPNNSTTSGCTGACVISYYSSGDYRCCSGTCTCTTSGSCP